MATQTSKENTINNIKTLGWPFPGWNSPLFPTKPWIGVCVCVCATWSQRAHKSIGSNPPVTRAHG